MEKELKDKIDATINEAVKDAKSETEKIESVVKRSVAFAPPQIIHNRGDSKTFSYCRLIKAMRDKDWSGAQFEKEAIEKAYPTPGLSSVLGATYGGNLVPPEYSMELIDMITAQAVTRQAGASIYPMTRDTLNIPTMTAGATCYWGAEAGTKTMDAETRFGQVQLVAKKMYCLVGISNELLADSSPAVETIVRRDITREMALKEDKAFLQCAGATGEPIGLTYWAGTSGDVLTVNGTLSLLGSSQLLYAGSAAALSTSSAGTSGGQPTYDDILNMLYLVESNNAKVTGFIMHPRTKNTLRKIQDTMGQYIYAIHPEQKVPDTLYGLPVFLTTQISITEDTIANGGATNLSHIICGDWSEFIIGQRAQIELAVSEHVGFQTDSTWIRATLRVDCDVKHAASFAVLAECQP